MSLSHELINLLGADVAKEVLTIVASKDAMKKYLATEKGKAAKKRSNMAYKASHERKPTIIRDTKEDVQMFIVEHCKDSVGHVFRTGTELWKFYIANGSKITRKHFLTLLPEMIICPYIMRDGKKVMTPSYTLQ